MDLDGGTTARVTITNSKGISHTVEGVLSELSYSSDYSRPSMCVEVSYFGPFVGTAPADKKQFSEIRKVQVIVPSLTPANIALAASQAGYDESAVFDVESGSGLFILTFRESYIVTEQFNDN